MILISALFLLAWRRQPLSGPGSAASPLPDHVGQGEALLHRFAPGDIDVSYRLPLASVATAVFFSHGKPPPWRPWFAVLGCCLLILFARERLRDPLGASLAAVFVPVLGCQLMTADAGLQSLYALLVALTAGLLVWRAQAPSLGRALALAVSLGVALLYRSPLVFFPPLLVLYEGLSRPRSARRGCRAQWALLLVVPYLFLAPWVRMNWAVHRQFIPFERGEAATNIVTGALGLIQTIEGDWQGTLLDAPIDDRRLGAVLGWAAAEVFRHPLRYLKAVAERIWFVIALHPWLIALSLLSARRLRARRGTKELAFLILYFVLIHCAMAVQRNYFDPLWPLLAALAAAPVFDRGEPAPSSAPRRSPAELALPGLLALALACCVWVSWIVLDYGTRAARRSPSSELALEEAFSAGPRDAWLLFERGRRSLADGRTQEAITDFYQAKAAGGRFGEDLYLAAAWLRAGRADEFLKLQGGSLNESSGSVEAFLLKASFALKRGRRSEAASLLRRGIELMDREVLVREGDTPLGSTVREALLSSAQSFPNHPLVQGMPSADKLALLKEMTLIAPGHFGFWLEQARLARQSGDRSLALASLERAENLNPAPQNLRRVALERQELKDYRRALALFSLLLARVPANPVSLADKGVCEYLAGSLESSRRDLEAAVALDGAFLPATLSLGMLETQAGRFDRAVSLYDRALSARGFSSAPAPLQQLVREARRDAALKRAD
ncbi:MAG: hypothetical protein HY077_10640 [Elusimicrobia bacterium]|nr:hypothetical protein [Elusimicrobiota bacterium]